MSAAVEEVSAARRYLEGQGFRVAYITQGLYKVKRGRAAHTYNDGQQLIETADRLRQKAQRKRKDKSDD